MQRRKPKGAEAQTGLRHDVCILAASRWRGSWEAGCQQLTAEMGEGTRLYQPCRELKLTRNGGRIRVLSADLQQVSTLTNVGVLDRTTGYPDGRLELLPDGRLLVGLTGRPGDKGPVIRVLKGFPAALL